MPCRPMCTGWLAAAKEAGIETVDIGAPLGLLLSVKDPVEVDMVKRAAILSNKVTLISLVVFGIRNDGCLLAERHVLGGCAALAKMQGE